jgi:hypothetical protein
MHATFSLVASRRATAHLTVVARPLRWATGPVVARNHSTWMSWCSSARPFNLYRVVALKPRARHCAHAATTAGDDDEPPPLPSCLILLTSWARSELLLPLRTLSVPLPPRCVGRAATAPPWPPWSAFVLVEPSLGPRCGMLGLWWVGGKRPRPDWRKMIFPFSIFCE